MSHLLVALPAKAMAGIASVKASIITTIFFIPSSFRFFVRYYEIG